MLPNGWHGASNDEAQIRAWWSRNPDANVGIACNPSGLAVLDVDHGLASAEDARLFLATLGVTKETYCVRTGRRPEFGVQAYFSGAIPDVGDWKIEGCSGQVKSLGGYVMAAGSIHPDSKLAYEVLTGSPDSLLATPAGVREIKPERKPSAVDDGEPITENRNVRLTSIAGKLRNAGLSADAIEAALLQVNADRCQPPLDEDEVVKIAEHAGAWKMPEDEPVAVIGGASAAVSSVVDETEDAEPLKDEVRPRYPDEVWAGTVYGDFADLCTVGNYIPKRFFSESMRCVVGALVGDRLQCTSIDGVNPRTYTIKIAPPGSGKGTSDAAVRRFFMEERWDGLKRTEAPLLWAEEDAIAWQSRGVGAHVVSPASAPGLINAIDKRKLKKGETANPMATWQPMPRVITLAEEVAGLFANFTNESTGAGLEAALCELFDRDSFTSTATKDRAPKSGKLMYSLLGGITKDLWDSVFSKTQSQGSGFMSRLFIIGTEEDRTASSLARPNFDALRSRLLPKIFNLEDHPIVLNPSAAAEAHMKSWYDGLQLPDGVSRARLNIHAWRVALHLAWLRDRSCIVPEDVEGGIKVAMFLSKMREYYAPAEGETRAARCEAAIRKIVSSKRRVKVRELKSLTHYKTYGLDTWEKALKALVRHGEVRVAEERQPSGQKAKMVILLKQKD